MTLKMFSTITDHSLFFKAIQGELIGAIGVYVYDTIVIGNSNFEKESKLTADKFVSSAQQEDNFKFAGMEIEFHRNGSFKIHQQSFAIKIDLLPENSTFNEYRSKLHELTWLTQTRPDVLFAVNMATQVRKQD